MTTQLHNINPFNSTNEFGSVNVPFPRIDRRFVNPKDTFGEPMKTEYPVGIAYPKIYTEATLGRAEQSSNSHKDTTRFRGSEAPLISDVLTNQYRGIYFQDTKLPYNRLKAVIPETLKTNYQLDLEQNTYYDGTPLGENALFQAKKSAGIDNIQTFIQRYVEALYNATQSQGEQLQNFMREARDAFTQANQTAQQIDINIREALNEGLQNAMDRVEALFREWQQAEEERRQAEEETKGEEEETKGEEPDDPVEILKSELNIRRFTSPSDIENSSNRANELRRALNILQDIYGAISEEGQNEMLRSDAIYFIRFVREFFTIQQRERRSSSQSP